MASLNSDSTTVIEFSSFPSTSAFHNLPRFGQSRNFSHLFDSTGDSAENYSRGLFNATILVSFFFVLWTIVLLVCVCLGPRRVGFFSGAAFVKPSRYGQRIPKYVAVSRILVVVAALTFLTFSVLFVTQGLTEVFEATDSVLGNADGVHTVAKDIQAKLNELVKVEATGAIERAVRMEEELARGETGTCLKGAEQSDGATTATTTNEGGSTVTNDTNSSGNVNVIDITTDGVDSQNTTNHTNTNSTIDGRFLADDDSFNLTELVMQLEADLAKFPTIAAPEETTEMYNLTNFTLTNSELVGNDFSVAGYEQNNLSLNSWQSLIIIIPYTIVPLCLLVATVFVWVQDTTTPCAKCFMDCFLLPLFVLQVVFSYVTVAAILYFAGANADFCTGTDSTPTPDATVRDILYASGYSEDSLIFQGVWYYVNQCRSSNPFEFFTDYESTIAAFNVRLLAYSAQLQETPSGTAEQVCGDEIRLLVEMIDGLLASLGRLIDLSGEMKVLLRCDRIVPYYTDTTYDATCTHSMRGVTWAFSTFLVVAFAGMVMLTLRASWAPLRKEKEEEDDEAYMPTATAEKPRVEEVEEEGEEEEYHDEPAGDPMEQKSAIPAYQGIVGQEEPAKQYSEIY